jgi:HEPN domain-containing protein
MENKINLNEKQDNNGFTALIELLVQHFTPVQIYRFAKVKQQEQLQSVFAMGGRHKQYVYYLLVVTEGSAVMERSIQDFVDTHYTHAKVVIHAHELQTLLKNSNQSNGFFASVFNQGKLCYTAPGTASLAEFKAPSPKKRLGRAVVHWRKRKEMATGFLEAAERIIEDGHEKIGVFLLHHAVEQACLGLIYVFMDYRPEARDLKQLLYVCACFSKLPLQHFLGTPDHEELLHMMMKSFTKARKQEDFSMADHSIYRFLEVVESFLKLATKLAETEFKTQQQAIDNVKKLGEELHHA